MFVFACFAVALALLGSTVPAPRLGRASRDLLAYWVAVDAWRADREHYVPSRALRPAPVPSAAPPAPAQALPPCGALTAVPEPSAALRAGTLRPAGWVTVDPAGVTRPARPDSVTPVRVRAVYQWRGEAHASVEYRGPFGRGRYKARLADLGCAVANAVPA